MCDQVKSITRKWTEKYLPDWKGRKYVVHARDLRDAGYSEHFIRRLPHSTSRLPGGKPVSEHVKERGSVHNLVQQISREKKLEAQRIRRQIVRENSQPEN